MQEAQRGGYRLHDNTDEHAAEQGRGEGRMCGEADWYSSITQIPSCMPCMSFLVFEAFFIRKRKKKKDQRKKHTISKFRSLSTSVQGFNCSVRLTVLITPHSSAGFLLCCRLHYVQVPEQKHSHVVPYFLSKMPVASQNKPWQSQLQQLLHMYKYNVNIHFILL